MRRFDALDVEATTGVASFFYVIYKALSPTRRRLALLEAGQKELKLGQEALHKGQTDILKLLVKVSKKK